MDSPIYPRRPYLDEKPDGYMESDQDFVLNNIDAAVELLERELTKMGKNTFDSLVGGHCPPPHSWNTDKNDLGK